MSQTSRGEKEAWSIEPECEPRSNSQSEARLAAYDRADQVAECFVSSTFII
jgi:hypothetical protein